MVLHVVQFSTNLRPLSIYGPSVAQYSRVSALCILEVTMSMELVCAVQFDDPKDTSKDPKVVNMNIRKRVMKGAAQGIKLPYWS